MKPKIIVEFLGHSITGARTIAKQLKGCYRYDVYRIEESVLLHVQDYEEQFPYLVLLEDRKWKLVEEAIFDENS